MRWVLLTFLACSGATSHPPAVHIYADGGFLYGRGVLYLQTADGGIFGGPTLTEPVPELAGASSISNGRGSGVESIAGDPSPEGDEWVCASVSGRVLCAGTDANTIFPQIAPVQCAVQAPWPPVPPNGATMCEAGATCTACIPSWTELPGFSDIIQVNRSCALSRDGSVTCWAGVSPPSLPGPVRRLGGVYAILTTGDLYSIATGMQIAGVANVVRADSDYSVALSYTTSCAVTSDEVLFCWGYNAFGQVGDGTTNFHDTPIHIADGVVDVRTSTGITCALMASGAYECWGASGALTPTPISALNNVVEMSSLSDVLLADGRVMELTFIAGTTSPDAPLIRQKYPPESN